MTQSTAQSQRSDRPKSFDIKGGLFPMTLLNLRSVDIDQIGLELAEKIRSNPAFFRHCALVIGVDLLTEDQQEGLDLAALHRLCGEHQLMVAAVRGGNNSISRSAAELRVAQLPRAKDRSVTVDEVAPASASDTPAVTAVEPEPRVTEAQPPTAGTRVISTPVRSGQQIYAPGGDLIVLTSVSPGAEVLADGNIHIYGPLRGRALAGLKGNEQARIFCGLQEAELVAIAGQFAVDESVRDNYWKQPCQICIEDDRLSFKPLYSN